MKQVLDRSVAAAVALGGGGGGRGRVLRVAREGGEAAAPFQGAGDGRLEGAGGEFAERAGGDAGQLEGALRRGLLQGAGVAAQLVRVVGLGERVGGLGRGRARLARHQL